MPIGSIAPHLRSAPTNPQPPFPLPLPCLAMQMRSATMWLGIAGGILMAILLFAGVKGSLVIGILFVTVISWIPGHGASYLGPDSSIAGACCGEGNARVEVLCPPKLIGRGGEGKRGRGELFSSLKIWWQEGGEGEREEDAARDRGKGSACCAV